MSTTEAGAEELALIVETAQRILCDEALDEQATWQRLTESGLLMLAVPEPVGGGWLAAAAAVVGVWAETGSEGPLPETLLVAGPMLHAAGRPVQVGRVTATVATGRMRRVGDGSLEVDLAAAAVAGAGSADWIVVVVSDDAGDVMIELAADRFSVTPGRNLAGEARDAVTLSGPVAAPHWTAVAAGAAAELRYRGALARAIAISAAADAALQLTIRYAGERTQFGRAIGRFQAVQHAVAELAIEVDAMSAASAVAVAVCAADGFATQRARLAVAVAKAQASAGAGVVARLAHQVHGAIGTTAEHPLHRQTTRLWSWRDELGSEVVWQADLGRSVLGSDVWEVVT